MGDFRKNPKRGYLVGITRSINRRLQRGKRPPGKKGKDY